MPTKAQIDKLHARIDALEEALVPRMKGCVIQYPGDWDMDKVFEQHCQTYPEDAHAEMAIFIPLLKFQPPPPGRDRSTLRQAQDLNALLAEHHKSAELYGNGWRSCDYESWRALARAEIAAGRDPNVTLRRS